MIQATYKLPKFVMKFKKKIYCEPVQRTFSHCFIVFKVSEIKFIRKNHVISLN